MDNTILIQVTNENALGLLRQLEKLQLIKMLEKNISPVKTKLSDKYQKVFSPEDAKSFNNHSQTMRNEWNNT